MDDQLRELLQRAERIASPQTSRRREDLVARATDAGYTLEFADLIYDVAEQENVDPAYAFALVLSNIGVRELSEPEEDGWIEAQVEAPPPWVTQPDPPAVAEQERHLRITFRRLRAAIEQHPESAQAALEAFASQPDVAEMKY